jgi:hypothetical protein
MAARTTRSPPRPCLCNPIREKSISAHQSVRLLTLPVCRLSQNPRNRVTDTPIPVTAETPVQLQGDVPLLSSEDHVQRKALPDPCSAQRLGGDRVRESPSSCRTAPRPSGGDAGPIDWGGCRSSRLRGQQSVPRLPGLCPG